MRSTDPIETSPVGPCTPALDSFTATLKREEVLLSLENTLGIVVANKAGQFLKVAYFLLETMGRFHVPLPFQTPAEPPTEAVHPTVNLGGFPDVSLLHS